MRLACLIAAALLSLRSLAADLTAELTPLVAQPRPAAPEWVEVKLTSRGSALREGALEFELHSGIEPIYRYRTHDLALTAGTQRIRFLLPASPLIGASPGRHWRLSFVARERTIALGEFASTPRLHTGRSLVLGVVRGVASGDPATWQALRIERLASASDSVLATAPVFLDPDDLPTDPLGYCAFDALLLEGDALSRLREKPRAALARWVHAGGSLAIVAPRGIDETHLAFLNALAAPDPHWRPLTQPIAAIATARANFGRLIVAAEPPPTTLPAEWRQAAGFLWKLRATPLRTLTSTERWADSDIDRRQLQWGDFSSSSSLVEPIIPMLLPSSIRPLPPAVLWTILAGFLVAVGPLDWFVLGRFRRRRLTWLVFPCIAIGCAALTVALARRYLGTTGHSASLIVTDIGADGTVVRETRLRLTLPASEGELATSVEAGLCSPVFTQHDHRGTAPLARFAGQFPARYRLTQPGRQWSPAITRTTSFAPAEDTSGIVWREPPIPVPGDFLPSLRGKTHAGLDVFRRGDRRSIESGLIELDWRKHSVFAPERGAFCVLSGVAPTGSPFLEDLACLDEKADDRSLILAITREGADIHLWRRLFLH